MLEAQSERKRAALRRAQEAAEEARRRAEEAARLRREAEYLGQFEPVAESDGSGNSGTVTEHDLPQQGTMPASSEMNVRPPVEAAQPTGEAAAVEDAANEAQATDELQDFEAIGEELGRRNNGDL